MLKEILTKLFGYRPFPHTTKVAVTFDLSSKEPIDEDLIKRLTEWVSKEITGYQQENKKDPWILENLVVYHLEEEADE